MWVPHKEKKNENDNKMKEKENGRGVDNQKLRGRKSYFFLLFTFFSYSRVSDRQNSSG